MKVNINEIIECGHKLYYDINPNSEMDVPSMFYERLEKEWVKWKESGSELSFYEYCKHSISDVDDSLPTDIEMDEQILKIMNENLVAGTVAENTEGIICNKFATSLKIVHYIKELMKK